MTAIAVIISELRRRSRHKGPFRARMTLAVIAASVVGIPLFIALAGGVGRPGGSGLFSILSWLAFVFALLEGLRVTADALSAEKREGTIGLLFLTDCRGFDIVLGKLVGAALGSLYALLAIFPMLAIPVLAGGVTGAEVWRLSVALVVVLLFSLSAGLFVSAFNRDEVKAWGGALTLLVFFVVILPMAAAIAPIAAVETAALFSPTTLFFGVRSGAAGLTPGFWESAVAVHALTWLFAGAAGFVLSRSWQDRPKRAPAREAAPIPVSKDRRIAEWRQGFHERARHLDRNPVSWLVVRNDGFQTLTWLVIAIWVVVIPAVLSDLSGSQAMSLAMMAGLVPCFVIELRIGVLSAQTLVEARRSGALELLASAPMSIREILNGYQAGLRSLFVWPVVIVTAIWLTLFAITLTDSVEASGLSLLRVLGFFSKVFMLAYAGMYFALKYEKPGAATGATIMLAILSTVIFALCCLPDFIAYLIGAAYFHDAATRRLAAAIGRTPPGKPSSRRVEPTPPHLPI